MSTQNTNTQGVKVPEINFEMIQNRADRVDAEVIKFVRNAQLYRDFTVEMAKQGIIDPYDIETPGYGGYISFNVYDEGFYDENSKWIQNFNEEASKAAIAKFFNAARKYAGNANVTKDYDYDEFRVEVKLHDDFTVYGTVKREAVCVKRVVEKKWIEPRVVEGHFDEKVEWDCETPSLLAVSKEA